MHTQHVIPIDISEKHYVKDSDVLLYGTLRGIYSRSYGGVCQKIANYIYAGLNIIARYMTAYIYVYFDAVDCARTQLLWLANLQAYFCGS